MKVKLAIRNSHGNVFHVEARSLSKGLAGVLELLQENLIAKNKAIRAICLMVRAMASQSTVEKPGRRSRALQPPPGFAKTMEAEQSLRHARGRKANVLGEGL